MPVAWPKRLPSARLLRERRRLRCLPGALSLVLPEDRADICRPRLISTPDIVIRAEGLGKKYGIRHEAERERYTALRDVIARKTKSLARSAPDLFRRRTMVADEKIEEFWALKNINFEIKRGEVVGIIGRNGAGKSTLLKILSRITEPSEGRVEINGRVASLLEVGTGFHPELSGRENIFLNGAILGMTRAEIRAQFDEIVAFAGVELFLDTPVKRYSSGMYVRLAFAVAAHLEPEILVVDEVLAVGDAEFQKKCLGKMQEFSRQHGRTVLFVSHNIAAIKSLCQAGIWLNKGQIEYRGDAGSAAERYLCSGAVDVCDGLISDTHPRLYSTGAAKLRRVQIINSNNESAHTVDTGKPFDILIQWEVIKDIQSGMIEVGIIDSEGRQVTQSFSCDGGASPFPMERGLHEIWLRIDTTVFPGHYSLLAGIHTADGATIDFVERAFDFHVLNTGTGDPNHYRWGVRGYLRPTQRWRGPFVLKREH